MSDQEKNRRAEELEAKLRTIQFSTKTLFPQFRGIHDDLRHQFHWYAHYHERRNATRLNTLALVLTIVLTVVFVARLLQPQLVTAAAPQFTQSAYRWFENQDVTTFNTITTDPTGSVDRIRDVASDADYLYLAGYCSGCGSSGAGAWRIEKRKKSDGSLETVFDSDGIVISDPTSGGDETRAIAVDDTSLYILGFCSGCGAVGGTATRIEKRNKLTGALESAFDTDGVVIIDSVSGADGPWDILLDETSLFVASDCDGCGSAGNFAWRIEKRDATTGAPVNAFDGDGVLVHDTNAASDQPRRMAVDGTYLYVVGYCNAIISPCVPGGGGGAAWKIIKVFKSNGTFESNFDGDGVLGSDPTSGTDHAYAVGIDTNYLYVGGICTGCGASGGSAWRIEKRNITDGVLVNAFDSDGVVISDPTVGTDELWDVFVDSTSLSVAGFCTACGASGVEAWRIEKRDKTDGSLLSAFDGDGVVVSDPTTGNDQISRFDTDADYLFVGGFDSAGANQWRFEKRDRLDGSLANGLLAGSPLAAQDTPLSVMIPVSPLRLRLLVHVGNELVAVNGQTFKLQYASRGSDNLCDTGFSGETYADVAAATPLAFRDNTNGSDGGNFEPGSSNPTHGSDTVRRQTYEEANTFTNGKAALGIGEDGVWDFSLQENNAGYGTFCFRVVKGDGSLLETYSVVPQITIVSNPPNTPTSLTQKRVDSLATIATGSWVNTNSVQFEGSITDPETGDTAQLCVEKKPIGTAFANVEDSCSTLSAQGTMSITFSGLPEGAYHWQVKAKDNSGASSLWSVFGSNAEADRDVGIDTSPPETIGAVVRDGIGNDIDTQASLTQLSANWAGFNDILSGVASYQYQITRDSDAKCWNNTDALWTSCLVWNENETRTSVTLTHKNLALTVGITYTTIVRAIDAVGNISGSVSSDRVQILAKEGGGTMTPPPAETPPPSSGTSPAPTPVDSLLHTIAQDVLPLVVPSTAAVATLIAAAQALPAAHALLSLSDFLLYLSYLWTTLLEWLGLKRKRKPWGVVYNAATKEPVPLIVVQLVDAKSGEVVEQRVTDPYGRFGFLPKPGTYRLKPFHPHFRFPSKISPHQGDLRYADLYHGKEIEIHGTDTVVAHNIPLDPIEKKRKAGLAWLRFSFRRLSFVLMGLSLGMQGFTVFIFPTTANLVATGAYLGVLVGLRFLLHQHRTWGSVYNAVTKKEIAGADVFVMEEGNPTATSRKVTDAFGRFYLLLPSGTYSLMVQREGYRFPSEESFGYHGEPVVVTPKQPLVHVDIPIEPGEPVGRGHVISHSHALAD